MEQVQEQKQEKHIIWSNMNLDLEDWKGDLEEDYPDRTEDEYYRLMHEINNDYLDDERTNLNVQLSTPILVCADIGRWDGRKSGYGMIKSGNISDCLSSECDYVEWYVDEKGDFRCKAAHHDGTNYYLYRAVMEHVPDWRVEMLQEKLYEGKASYADIDRVTRRLGDDIAAVYGFVIPPAEKGIVEMEKVDIQKEFLEEVELLGRTGLFTELRVDRETVPEGIYCYELRHGDDDSFPATVEEEVRVNYFGAVLFTEPIDLGEEKRLETGYDDFGFTGEQMYLSQIQEKKTDKEEKEAGKGNMEDSLDRRLRTGINAAAESGVTNDGYEVLTTGTALVGFMDNNDMLFHMTENEADKLCGYMDGHGFVIGQKEGRLYCGDLCKDTDKIVWEETTIDDLVDMACEWNFTMLEEARNEMENPDNFIDFVGKHSRYESLCADEKILDAMFDRTKYKGEIDALAETLAAELIRDIQSKDGIDGAIAKMKKSLEAGKDLLPDVSPALKKDTGRKR